MESTIVGFVYSKISNLTRRLRAHPEHVAERSESSNDYDCRWQSYLNLCEARRRITIDTAESHKMGILRHCVPQDDRDFDCAMLEFGYRKG